MLERDEIRVELLAEAGVATRVLRRRGGSVACARGIGAGLRQHRDSRLGLFMHIGVVPFPIGMWTNQNDWEMAYVIKKTTPPSVAASDPIAKGRVRGEMDAAPANSRGSAGARKPMTINVANRWVPMAKPRTAIVPVRLPTWEIVLDKLTHPPRNEDLQREDATGGGRSRNRGSDRAELARAS